MNSTDKEEAPNVAPLNSADAPARIWVDYNGTVHGVNVPVVGCVEYVRADLASPVTQDGLTDPRDMTDAELSAEIKALESRVYTLKSEGAKMWRFRLRAGCAIPADHIRLKEIHKRRANKETQPS